MNLPGIGYAKPVKNGLSLLIKDFLNLELKFG